MIAAIYGRKSTEQNTVSAMTRSPSRDNSSTPRNIESVDRRPGRLWPFLAPCFVSHCKFVCKLRRLVAFAPGRWWERPFADPKG